MEHSLLSIQNELKNVIEMIEKGHQLTERERILIEVNHQLDLKLQGMMNRETD